MELVFDDRTELSDGFIVCENEIFDMGDHGDVQYVLVIEVVGEVNSFWRTYYNLNGQLDFVDCNDDNDVFEFARVQSIVKAMRGWEECE
jgi:hypothetical protein